MYSLDITPNLWGMYIVWYSELPTGVCNTLRKVDHPCRIQGIVDEYSVGIFSNIFEKAAALVYSVTVFLSCDPRLRNRVQSMILVVLFAVPQGPVYTLHGVPPLPNTGDR